MDHSFAEHVILTKYAERLYLLCHILRMIVEPQGHQHADIRKLNLTVAKLEEVTWEALSGWFADVNNPANAQKKTYLEEIFKVAKQEERYRDGKIGRRTHNLLLLFFNSNMPVLTKFQIKL